MRLRTPLAVAAASAAVLATPAEPQTPCAAPWVQDELMRDALRFNGWTLEAWALNAAGNMEELWRLEGGEWMVVETTAGHCSTVRSHPAQFGGRLSTPSNDADTFGQGRMQEGERA